MAERSGVVTAYLAMAKKGVWVHPPQIEGSATPKFAGTGAEFLATVEEPRRTALEVQMKNRVRKCSCGKPCAASLAVCNACGLSLADVPISYTPNVFTAFILGIGLDDARRPATISFRRVTPRVMVFDDFLCMTPLHLNAVPTTHYIPDWRHLLRAPRAGLAVLDELLAESRDTALGMLRNDAYRQRFFNGDAEEVVAEGLMVGLNFPPSQFQLHVQVMCAPLFPQHWAMAQRGEHYHYNRFFPASYVRDALAAAVAAGRAYTEPLSDSDPPDAALAFCAALGVEYAAHHAAFMRRVEAAQARFGVWQRGDFDAVVVGAGVLPFDSATPRPALKDVQATDKTTLMTYGRPFTAAGAPTGSYYPYAGDATHLAAWPPAGEGGASA